MRGRRLSDPPGTPLATTSMELSAQLNVLTSRLEVLTERISNRLDEQSARLTSLGSGQLATELRVRELELAGANRQAALDQLRDEAARAYTLADSKSNRGVSQVGVLIAALALLLTLAQQVYTR